MSEIEEQIDRDEMEPHVYEASFHIVPSLTEDDVKAEFNAVKKLLESKEGFSLISEAEPKLRTLAYSLSKTVKAVKSTYSKAYFGWVKFTTFPDKIGEIKTAMDEDPSILRYLIIHTVKENTMVTKFDVEGADSPEAKEEDSKKEGKEDAVPKVKISEDIDKTIEELVIQ